MLHLRVDWGEAQLAPYHLPAWSKPAVHASAAPEALAATVDVIRANAEYAVRRDEARRLPYKMLDELKHQARCNQPGVAYPSR